ncbi:hypothetical protein IWZ01DRAFT_559938 [Phyllosticta capitalensis]
MSPAGGSSTSPTGNRGNMPPPARPPSSPSNMPGQSASAQGHPPSSGSLSRPSSSLPHAGSSASTQGQPGPSASLPGSSESLPSSYPTIPASSLRTRRRRELSSDPAYVPPSSPGHDEHFEDYCRPPMPRGEDGRFKARITKTNTLGRHDLRHAPPVLPPQPDPDSNEPLPADIVNRRVESQAGSQAALGGPSREPSVGPGSQNPAGDEEMYNADDYRHDSGGADPEPEERVVEDPRLVDDGFVEDDEYDGGGYGLYRGEQQEQPIRIDDWQDPFLTQLPRIDFDEPDTADTQQYINDFAESYEFLLQRVWDEEKKERNLSDVQYESFMDHGLTTLCTMSAETVASIIDGTLPRVASDPDTPRQQAYLINRLYEAEYEHVKDTGIFQPCIYAQYLCDEQGNGPSKRQLLRIMATVSRYVNRTTKGSDETARKMDSAHPPRPDTSLRKEFDKDQWSRNWRKFLHTGTDAGRKQRIKHLEKWIIALRERVGYEQGTPLPPDFDEPTRPLSEFGYTNNHRLRFNDHENHWNSNFIMNLIEAACTEYLPSSCLRIRRFVVHMCWDPEQGWVGEILLNRLGLSYTNTGYGLSFHSTGRNNRSIGSSTVGQYNKWAALARAFTPFRETIENQILIQIKIHREKKASQWVVSEKQTNEHLMKAGAYREAAHADLDAANADAESYRKRMDELVRKHKRDIEGAAEEDMAE